MITATVTLCYHRDAHIVRKGHEVTRQMEFADFAAMTAYGERINAGHETVNFHVTRAWIDEQNFIYFDCAEIYLTYDGDLYA